MKNESGIPSLARDTFNDLSRLVKLEIRLAAEQVKRQAAKKAISGAAGGAGALFLLFGLLFAVAGGALFLGGLLGAIAAAGLKSGGGVVPEATKGRIREDVRWLREKSS